ncbi:MAG: flagellar basal body rod protein FlgC [Acidaminococcales bacterium]|jgi:flagellar basal-body rod protein FlgC|nr:flagellar basal body rod protein FlgC [Acidaminococcales bacterium]
MSMFGAIDAAGSGMTAERLRLDVISNNLANANTTRTNKGGPFRRQVVVYRPRDEYNDFGRMLTEKLEAGKGVRVVGIVEDNSPSPVVYDPYHPDADVQGYVRMPNINVVAEMVDMITASRSYEANVASIAASKAMAAKALEIGR